MNSAQEARQVILNGALRRKMARQQPVPVLYEGVTYSLHQPPFEEAYRIGELVNGDKAKMIGLIVEQYLYYYGERVFSRGDSGILLADNPNELLALCTPIVNQMLSTAPVKAPTAPGEHPALQDAIDLSMELASGSCRRCEVPVDKKCVHRAARVMHRCGHDECTYFVRKRGDLCAIHAWTGPTT